MGGKKYPKKTGSEASGSSQKSTPSTGSSTPSTQGPSGRQHLIRLTEQMSISDQPGQRPQQGGQQQQRSQQQGGQRPQQGGQQPQRPQQQGGQRPQQSGQPQQQGGQRPQQGGQQPQRSQQQGGQRPQQSGQPQQQGGQQQQAWGGARPKQTGGDRRQPQSGMSRAESVQSVRSEQSSSSGGGQRKEQQKLPQLTMADLKKQGIDELKITYKGPGKRGRSLGQIETNYLPLLLNKLADNAYHYDVKINPDRPKKLLTMVFLEFVKQNFPSEPIAFDGQNNAYAKRQLKIGDLEREVKILHPETQRERTFTVSIQAANDSEIPLKRALSNYQQHGHASDPKRAMQAMEVILKSAFYQDTLKHGVVGGRSFFLPDDKRIYLGDFYELWLGLFQSMVLGRIPYLNVDVNHKGFPRRYASLIELLKDMDRNFNANAPFDNNLRRPLQNHLKGLEICYEKPNDKKMIYKFRDITDPPGEITFKNEKGEVKTIAKYFQETGRQIKYPRLPCIMLGNAIKNIQVPLEMCSIPDTQIINKKCTEQQTTNIIRYAATSTDERKRKIMELLQKIKHNDCSTIKEFGINIGLDFAKVPARQLEAPGIQYKNRSIKPVRGVWRAENEQFLMTDEKVIEWTILNTNYRTRYNELTEFGNMLVRVSGSTGLKLAPRPQDILMFSERDLPKIRKEIDRIGQERKISIVFCVVPDSGQTYSDIKKYAEIESKNGVLTQCIKGGTIFRKRNDGSTISNILLKVNAKLNGTNHRLQETPILMDKNNKCLLIGADVTHPSPEQTKIPSVVGVAASFDMNGFCYKFYWRLQGQRMEIISDFKEIIKEHLKFYKQKNGSLPTKIFYYRDGVSEGQFDQVMATESKAIKDACQEIQSGYGQQVKQTVVVVQKRHHTRFFPGKTGVGRDDRKNNNVPCGTIVDTEIIRPQENHFYLVSHQSIQGVAKPTKYCILLDEANHNIDDLQGLTYNLCHLFTRCNRAVSYPAPTYYAHLAAYRGRVYIENERLNMNNLQAEWNRRQINENIINDRPMFFV